MKDLLHTTTKTTAGFAVALVIVGFGVFGVDVGIGTVVGGMVALLNWAVLRWTMTRIMDAGVTARAGLSMLLTLKMGALAVLAFIIIRRLEIDALGFMLGFGALVFGILTASILYSAPVTPAAQMPAGASPASGNNGEEL